jgi:hypothetical protein
MKNIKEPGHKAYLVHTRYAVEKKPNGRIIPARLKTYKNQNGKIVPVYAEIGNSRNEISTDTYKVYHTLEKAIEGIKSK